MILKEMLTQYKNYVYLEDENSYSQLTISNNGIVSHRDIKKGEEIGRKRQFVIDLVTNPHTLIFTRQGVVDGSIGIVPKELDGYIVTENMPMFSINSDIVNPQYLIMFLKSKEYKEQIRKIIPSGTAQKALHEDKWVLIEINLPPLKEQNQIVSKYLKCLPNLEKAIVKTSKQEKYVSSLRQAILQQAVEGKICEQDQTDEPASVLLEKIKAEKEKLIAEKKIKKQKDLPLITEEEKPFDLPQGWEWCRLGEIANYITDGKHGDCENQENSGYYFISAKDIVNGKIIYRNARQIIKRDFTEVHQRTNLEPNDILVPNTGASIGKIAISQDEEITKRTTFQKSVAIIKYNDSLILPTYLCNAVLIEVNKIQKILKGTAMVNLLLSEMRNFILPLPPLAEQQRIVEKVDKLMSLCDELEQEVTNAKKYASQLMEAVLQEAFNNKQAETKNSVIIFLPQPQQVNSHKQILAAAARGKMSEATWKRIAYEAVKLASEEN